MIIQNVIGRELTDGEIQSMHRFRSYTDGIAFACLREGVMVMLLDEPETKPEPMLECARGAMEEALCTHPDFTIYDMPDGHILVTMESGLCAVSGEPMEDSMFNGILLRGMCLESCEAGEIIALCYEED